MNADGRGSTPAREQVWFWTPEWREKEREADRDLARGRYRDFPSPEEALGWFKGKNTRKRWYWGG